MTCIEREEGGKRTPERAAGELADDCLFGWTADAVVLVPTGHTCSLHSKLSGRVSWMRKSPKWGKGGRRGDSAQFEG